MEELIVRMLSGIASPEERSRVERWRGESPDNEAAYREIGRVWALTAPDLAVADVQPPDARRIIVEAEERRTTAVPIESAPSRRRWPPLRRSAAWAAALAAGIAAVALGVRLAGTPGAPPLATLAAVPGETLTATLDDGSLVRLAPGSRVEDRSTADLRSVSLRGRAFFAVVRDEDRPFEVRTEAGAVRVLGTRFDMLQRDDDLRVVVVEGRVAVSNERGSVEVERGGVARIAGGAGPVASVGEDVFALLDWPDGVLVYRATPLAEVAEEVSRQFGRPVSVEGAELGATRISASFEDESFEEVVESLCAVAGARCTFAGPAVTMSPATGAGEA